MRLLRWALCFPVAMFTSLVAWALMQEALEGVAFGYGGGILRSTADLLPIAASAAMPALVFVVSGVLLAPSKKRPVAFTFFGLALLFSGGGVEMLRFQDLNHVFWLSAGVGQVVGGILGLCAALTAQAWRSKRPNQPPQRNAGSRPSSGDSSVAEAPSTFGPRG